MGHCRRPLNGFEPISASDAQSTRYLLDAMTGHLGHSEDALWEELGLYLITHARIERL